MTILVVLFTTLYINLYIFVNSPQVKAEVLDTRVEQVQKHFEARNMPLSAYAKQMVEVSDANGLDWRLLPAIAIRETSGGKHMCKNNPFGWGSCKIGFKSVDESITVVGYKLANLPVYKDKTVERKLYYYNGTVVKTYPSEVIAIMNSISKTK